MTLHKSHKRSSVGAVLFIVLFMMMVSLPYVAMKAGISVEDGRAEKRELAAAVPFAFSTDFADDYENYFGDHFGFRSRLVNSSNHIKFFVFGSSPEPARVMRGKEQWLYFSDTAAIMPCYAHRNLMSSSELELRLRHWESLQAACSVDSITYIRVFWPEKQTIYPEYMPWSMRWLIRGPVSLADQMVFAWQKYDSPLRFVDVRQDLLKGKANHQLYLKFDTHWNSYGAFLAYRSFFRQTETIFKVKPLNVADYDISTELVTDGDLLQFIGIPDQSIITDRVPVFRLKQAGKGYSETVLPAYPEKTTYTRNPNCGNRLKVLCFSDSFGMALQPFFSMSIYEMIFYWGYYEPEVIRNIKPDVVIDATVERNL